MRLHLIIKIFVTLVIVIILSVVSYAKLAEIIDNKKDRKEESLENLQTKLKQDNNKIKEADVAKSDISDWLTYKNEENGFEIKYPLNWKIGGGWRNGKEKSLYYVYLRPPKWQDNWFDLQIFNNSTLKQTQQLLTTFYKNRCKIQNINYLELDSIQMSCKIGLDKETDKIIIFNHSNKIFQMRAPIIHDDFKEYVKITNKLFENFRIID